LNGIKVLLSSKSVEQLTARTRQKNGFVDSAQISKLWKQHKYFVVISSILQYTINTAITTLNDIYNSPYCGYTKYFRLLADLAKSEKNKV